MPFFDTERHGQNTHSNSLEKWTVYVKTNILFHGANLFPSTYPLLSQFGPQTELPEVPSALWAKHKNHVRFVTSALPHNTTLKANAKLPMVRQYHLPYRSIAGIEGVVHSLLNQGVLIERQNLCNTPILPIPKPN